MSRKGWKLKWENSIFPRILFLFFVASFWHFQRMVCMPNFQVQDFCQIILKIWANHGSALGFYRQSWIVQCGLRGKLWSDSITLESHLHLWLNHKTDQNEGRLIFSLKNMFLIGCLSLNKVPSLGFQGFLLRLANRNRLKGFLILCISTCSLSFPKFNAYENLLVEIEPFTNDVFCIIFLRALFPVKMGLSFL